MIKKQKAKLKMHIKQQDKVKIISGDYKGTIGIVQKIIRKTSQVVINNVNLKTKHMRPKQENEAGQIIKIEAPIHSSNVMLYSEKEKIASRYSKIQNSNNNKQRILRKTNEIV